MAFKAVVVCTFAFVFQVVTAQTCYRSTGAPSSCVPIAVSDNGGPLAVTSIGPIVPSGIAVATDLGLAGSLDVSGALPYLSAVAFEGQFDTSGTAPVTYGCGDCVAITQEVGNPSGNNAAVSSGLTAGSISGCPRRS